MSSLESIRLVVVPKPLVGLIHLERKRKWPSCRNPETGNQWSDDMKAKIIDMLEQQTHFHVFRADSVKVNDDASLRNALARCTDAKVDVLLAIQPVISDGRLAPVMAQVWEQPVVMWATPEEQSGEMISGNSLVGTHLMSANLRQLGFDVQLVYGNLDWALAEAQLLRGVNVAFAARMLKKAKIALVGYQAPGFQDFHPNPFLLRQTFGVLLLHISMAEYVQTATLATDQEEIDKDGHLVVHQLKLPFKPTSSGFGAEESDLADSSRHYLAMKKLMQEYNLDGLAVRCWPELPGPKEQQGGLDQWCYMALARLTTEGFPIACEGDVDGALGCLVAKLLGCGAVYLSDWLEHDQKTLTLWHGGMAPFQLSEAVGTPLGPCISRHFNNRKAGCLDATIKIGVGVTVFRFWVFQGRYHAIILEGRTVKPKRHLLGNNGLVLFDDSVDLTTAFESWLQHGFPHHICVCEGEQARAIRAIADMKGIKVLANK